MVGMTAVFWRGWRGVMRGRAMATGAMDADSISRAYQMGALMRRRWAHRPPLDGNPACAGLRLNKQVIDKKGFFEIRGHREGLRLNKPIKPRTARNSDTEETSVPGAES